MYPDAGVGQVERLLEITLEITMDNVRPLLRVFVVCLSLVLMVAYVGFSGRRSGAPAAAPGTTADLTTTATAGIADEKAATPPAVLIFGSKSAPVFGETVVVPGTLQPVNTPTTTPSKLMSGSKSMVLDAWTTETGILAKPPATLPTTPVIEPRR